MNTHILDPAVQEYILKNRDASPCKIALKKSPFPEVTSSEIASQVDGWQRATKKLPTWAFTENIYYPDKINMEQCSSEQTAIIKKNIIHAGAKVVDVTGGYSVDTCYIAQKASSVVHCELNAKLSQIVQYNATQLGVHNLNALATDGVEYVRHQPDHSLDYIYIDPSRRVNHSKVFLMEDCEPNIVELQHLFFQKARFILTKLSPLMDIKTALQKLNYVKDVYTISVDGECKELLFLQDREFEGEIIIHAVRIYGTHYQTLSFTPDEEKNAVVEFASPQAYLYDPDAALTKSGGFKVVAPTFSIKKLNANTHLYTSEELRPDFPGRIYVIKNIYSFHQFKKSSSFIKANVVAKNFPMSVEEIRKKYKIKDGGVDFLYFTTDLNGQHLVVHCVKNI